MIEDFKTAEDITVHVVPRKHVLNGCDSNWKNMFLMDGMVIEKTCS